MGPFGGDGGDSCDLTDGEASVRPDLTVGTDRVRIQVGPPRPDRRDGRSVASDTDRLTAQYAEVAHQFARETYRSAPRVSGTCFLDARVAAVLAHDLKLVATEQKDGGATPILTARGPLGMVEETERDGMTWYKCEMCGLMFDNLDDAKQHEENCDAEEPSYLQ